MKLVKIPPGRFLAQFPVKKEKIRGIIIPGRATSLRREEVATVIMKGDPAPRNGQLFDIPVRVGDLVWVHSQFGDEWQPEEAGIGEIRSYDFLDYRGTVEEEKEGV